MERSAGQSPSSTLLVRELTPRVGSPVTAAAVTVLLGPGNCGKTQVLSDILWLASGADSRVEQAEVEVSAKVLGDLSLAGKISLGRLLLGLTRLPTDEPDAIEVQGFGPDLTTACRQKVGPDLKHVLQRPLITARAVSATPLGDFMPLRLVYLETASRTSLLRPSAAGNPLQAPVGLLQALQDAPAEVLEQLNAAFGDAFPGHRLWLDDSQRVELSLRVAPGGPESTSDPIGRARQFAALPGLDEQGDAWRSFAVIVLAMLLARGRIVLIDEPELHLPPATARALGSWISAQSAPLDCQVFLATNSPSLVEGLFAGPADITMVRAERQSDTTTLRATPPEVARALVRHPLVSGARGVECFFADRLVLVPDSADRVLLEAVARQTEPLGRTRFVPAHGSEHLSELARLLRRAGFAFRVVTGLEIFHTEDRFVELVEAATGEPPSKPWLATRERLASYVEGAFDDASLSASTQEVERFLDELKQGSSLSAPDPAAEFADEEAGSRQQWQRLEQEQAHFLPPELRIWVEELFEDLKPKRIFVSPRGPVWRWFADSHRKPANVLLPAIERIEEGRTPADLRAFVTELLAFPPPTGIAGGSSAAPRPAAPRERT